MADPPAAVPPDQPPAAVSSATVPPTAPTRAAPTGVLEAADLAARLRAAETELAQARARLRRLESSTAVAVAQLLVTAARDPRAALRAPRELGRLVSRWQARGGRRTPLPLDTSAPATSATPVVGTPAGDELGSRLLGSYARTLVLRDRPVVAAILPEDGVATWAVRTHLTRLRPDEAVAVFEAAAPDVLVVDAAAGVVGPWAHLGTFAAPERERTLLALVNAASRRRTRTVLWLGGAAGGGWAELAPLFADIVRDDEPSAVFAAVATAAVLR